MAYFVTRQRKFQLSDRKYLFENIPRGRPARRGPYIQWLIKGKHHCKNGGIAFKATLFHFRLTPTILWAQRSDTILLTVSLSDIKNEKVSLEDGGFSFKANAGPKGELYSVDMTFHKEIIPQVSIKLPRPQASTSHFFFAVGIKT